MNPTTIIAAGLGIVAAWLYVLRRGSPPQLSNAGPPAPMAPPAATPNPPQKGVW